MSEERWLVETELKLDRLPSAVTSSGLFLVVLPREQTIEWCKRLIRDSLWKLDDPEILAHSKRIADGARLFPVENPDNAEIVKGDTDRDRLAQSWMAPRELVRLHAAR